MASDVAPAEPFGPYLVYERLGVGGMATVHRALERGIEDFERIVALKRLLPHLAEDASFIKSFVREAKLASILNHVNVVQIYELGRVGTEYFISMEYIDGRDIRRILRHARKVTGPPPIHVTVGLLLQLCEALDYAHTKVDDRGVPLGLVHRDVSPSNLLITKGGHLKVIDFGIAKAQSTHLRTQTGRVKGKLAYMAPEAIAGRDLDARSDLFAVGVIAHELLTARPLFASKNEYQTLLKVQRGDIMPPSTFNQACPAELDAVVLKALARDPSERFASAGLLRDALHDLRRHYNLQTGHRDVAQWIEWAFSVEPPSGGFAATGTMDTTATGSEPPLPSLRSRPSPLSPGRARRDDDDAVEIAWGGAEGEHDAQPVVLEDVPDVSAKHLVAPRGSDADAHMGVDDLDDDIPPPQPSHGSAPRMRTSDLARGSARPSAIPLGGSGPIERPSGITLYEPAPALRTPVPAAPDEPAARAPASRGRPRSAPDTREIPRLVDAPTAEYAIAPSGERASPASASIGSALLTRTTGRRRAAAAVGALLALGGTAVAVLALRGASDDARPALTEAHAPPPRATGTVRFIIEPNDAQIRIEGHPPHRGSPWTVELPAGVHPVAIQHGGYKAWLTSIELSASETQTLRVVLEPLAGAAAAAEATLTLASTPDGLEVVLNGQALAQRTPLRMPIKPGSHTIVLRQGGREVWRQQLDAQPATNYEFTPSMTEAKQRERAARAEAPRAGRPEARTPTVPGDADPAESGSEARVAASSASDPDRAPSARPPVTIPALPAVPSIGPVEPAPAPPPIAIAPAPAAPPVPAPRPAPSAPVLVPPTAVTRIAGATPTVGKSQRGEVPPVVAAKVCITATGRVADVAVVTKLERRTSNDLIAALRDWAYKPYLQAGVAVPACFVVTFRTK
jgi:serine/threonine protein kinase